jgi:AraC-like DNA-binding protein
MSNSKKIPIYSICRLLGDASKPIYFMATHLSRFISENPNIIFPHKHDFYQLLYIAEGEGTHIIDFKNYPVQAGNFYFLSPGMMHTWQFEGSVEGVLINFEAIFFQSFLQNDHYLSDFPFFHSWNNPPILCIPANERIHLLEILEHILVEYHSKKPYFEDAIRATMIQLFVFLNRHYAPNLTAQATIGVQNKLREFEKLVDTHYLGLRLPREYAKMMNISPNYLTEICTQTLGKSSGFIIRERVLLESKRLLVHSKQTISEIAYQLNFEDTSYFGRFFKKHTGTTPEQFRIAPA